MAGKLRIWLVLLVVALALTSIFYINQTVSSQIIISDQMSEFIDIVDRSTLHPKENVIVFDIDDTTFMSTKMVGTPTWFYNAVNNVRQNGAARYEAYQVVTDIDRVVQENVMVQAVENSTVSAIKTWQNQGSIVIALTSRPPDIAKTTETQLANIGLNFSSDKFACIEKKWKPKFGVFQNGVIYAGDFSNKCEVFRQFYSYLLQCGVVVNLIAHADDQAHYVSEMARFASHSRVPFVGIIYGGAVSARSFDLAKANNQLFELEEILGRKIVPDQYREIFTPKDSSKML